MTQPYYQDEAVTIYHGDCREIVPTLGRFDAVVTDPPYGVDFDYAGYDDTHDAWAALMEDIIPKLKKAAPFVVMPAGDRMALRQMYIDHSPDWIIAWFKGSPGTRSPIGFNSWEPHLTWGKPYKAMHDAFQTRCGFELKGHPCPKPLAWAMWLVQRAAPHGGTVLDPFAGSGTTGRAAKDLGRKAVLIELEERYCEIAANRMAQGVLDFGGIEPSTERLTGRDQLTADGTQHAAGQEDAESSETVP